MTNKVKLFLIFAAITTNACTHTEQPETPEPEDEPAPVAREAPPPEPAPVATPAPTSTAQEPKGVDAMHRIFTQPGPN
jgi:hypothetical protein